MTPSQDDLLAIARAGVLAPSADNRHVFRIEWLADGLRLWPTAEFAANVERHRRVLGLLSLGAVAENMRLRAGALGWRADIGSGPAANGALVELRLRPEPTASDLGLSSAIEQRQTNRKMYRGPVPDAAALDALSSAAATGQSGVTVHWLQATQRRQVLGLIWRAESERFLRRRLHEELFSSIRFDLDWRQQADQALSPGSLEVEAPMRPLFKAMRHWPLMRALTWVGAHRMLGLRAGWLPCWQAPALGIVTTSDSPEAGAFSAGAAFQRLWLRATTMNLAVQPMAAAAVLRLQSDEDAGASAGLRASLDEGWARVFPGETPVMVFRLGRAPRAQVTSGRQPLDHYLAGPTASTSG